MYRHFLYLLQSYSALLVSHEALTARSSEQETTLQELGDLLSQTKLEAEALKDQARRRAELSREMSWQNDDQVGPDKSGDRSIAVGFCSTTGGRVSGVPQGV